MAKISVVIPIYCNAPTLPALFERLNMVVKNNPQHCFEFICVDDGSGDTSFQILQSLAQKNELIRGIKLARNFGEPAATLAGITFASGDAVAVLAADLQDPPEDLNRLIVEWEQGYKVVLAVRKDRHGDPILTRFFSYIFNVLFRLVYRDYSPQGIGFFLIDRQVVNVIIQCEEKNAHLIGLIIWTGFPHQTIMYDRPEREEGKSMWNISKKIKYFIDAFVSFTYLPLRVCSVTGFIFAIAGGVFAINVIIERLTVSTPVPGWAALTVIVLILSGVQLIMMGVIGEYLWRNFDATRKRPIFIVDSVIGQEQEKTGDNKQTESQ